MTHSDFNQSIIIGTWAAAPEAIYDWHRILLQSNKELEADQLQIHVLDPKTGADRTYGDIAVLPLHGIILSRGRLPGATSAELFRKEFSGLIDDPTVRSILLDIDSYGGQIGGIPETSDLIYRSRGKKPITAIAHFVADAGAYWIGTAADEMVVSPSGEAGGIGVMALHNDESGKLKKEGIKRTLISAGKYKIEGNPWEPLTEEARVHIQESVGIAYDQFIQHVARNRGIAPSFVRDGFGQGRVVSASKAVQLHMVDREATFDETIERLRVQNTSQIRQERSSSAGSLLNESHSKVKSRILTPDQEIEAENLRKRVQAILNRAPAIRKPY